MSMKNILLSTKSFVVNGWRTTSERHDDVNNDVAEVTLRTSLVKGDLNDHDSIINFEICIGRTTIKIAMSPIEFSRLLSSQSNAYASHTTIQNIDALGMAIDTKTLLIRKKELSSLADELRVIATNHGSVDFENYYVYTEKAVGLLFEKQHPDLVADGWFIWGSGVRSQQHDPLNHAFTIRKYVTASNITIKE